MALIELARRAVDLVAGANREDFLDRAFADEDVLVLPVRHDHRHPAPREIERNFVDLGKALVDLEDAVQLDMLEYGDIEQIPQPGLKVAVEISVSKHALGFLAADIQMPLENDPILRQRAGLVGA